VKIENCKIRGGKKIKEMEKLHYEFSKRKELVWVFS